MREIMPPELKVKQLRAVLPEPEKLLAIAAWLDVTDAVARGDVPLDVLVSVQKMLESEGHAAMQSDLRAWAAQITLVTRKENA